PPPMAGLMVAMRQHYPKLTVRIRTTEDPIGSLERGVDAAMAIGVREPEGRWKSIEVARVERRLVASPSYLERTGVPDSVETLAERDLLTWDAPDGSGNRLPIVSGGSLEVQPIVESPDIHLVRQLTAHGLGIAFTPDAGLPEPGLPLVPVMPDVVRDEVPVRIIVAAANEDRPRIRALLTEIYGLIAKLNPEMVKR
ncbi:MAG: LysR substrate-binding domain-containing protein, partial [Myxococcota bacterium]